MVITELLYHFATGKSSKNRGKFYRCRKNKTNDIMKACCIYPVYRDSEGKERIFDTRWDLIEEGLFPANSDLTFEVMKEALLDSPCMLGPAKSVNVDEKKEKEKEISDSPKLTLSPYHQRGHLGTWW
jgi:hypothetical protein